MSHLNRDFFLREPGHLAYMSSLFIILATCLYIEHLGNSNVCCYDAQYNVTHTLNKIKEQTLCTAGNKQYFLGVSTIYTSIYVVSIQGEWSFIVVKETHSQ